MDYPMNPYNTINMGFIIIPILKMRKLRLREVKQLAMFSFTYEPFFMCCTLCLENAISLFFTGPPSLTPPKRLDNS